MTETSFTVTGIHCDGCARNIETGLSHLDGVRRVAADAVTKVVRVRYDETRLDTESLAAHLEKLGFPGTEAQETV